MRASMSPMNGAREVVHLRGQVTVAQYNAAPMTKVVLDRSSKVLR